MNTENKHDSSLMSSGHDNAKFIDLGKLLYILRRNWYLFILTLLVTGSLAYVYNRYIIPKYLVSATLLVEEGKSQSNSDAERVLQGFNLNPSDQNIYNQIYMLASWIHINNTLDILSKNFDIDYYRKGPFKRISYYPSYPIEMVTNSIETFPKDVEFMVEQINEFYYSIRTTKIGLFEIDTVAPFGDIIESQGQIFAIIKKPNLENLSKNSRIYFVVHKRDNLIRDYQRRLEISKVSREGSIIKMNIEGTNRKKDIDFLNSLIDEFIIANLETKNSEASRIVEFIDNQLISVSDSLRIAENRLQDFRSENKVMDVSAQGQLIIEQAVVLESEKARLALESDYFEYLASYLTKVNSKEAPIAPARMGVNDQVLESLIQRVVDLQAEYLGGDIGNRNPIQSKQLVDIENTKKLLNETLKSLIQANRMANAENLQQIRSLNAKATDLPITERQLLGIERQFQLNDVLYEFLLEKKSEAQIRKASNSPDNKLLEASNSSDKPVSPKQPLVYMVFSLMGLGILSLIILINDSKYSKVLSEEELSLISGLPIVGHLPEYRLKYQTIVFNEPESIVAEAFRSLRARLDFFIRENQKPIILVTSSMPFDGKSFTAVNLASVYSLIGKRTLLIGCDLRRPNLSVDFDIEDGSGLSSHLIGKKSLDDIIYKTHFQNFYIIPSGPLPPNPAELLASDKMKLALEQLRSKFDCVIIDSAPLGVVSDSYSLASLADTTLIVVRRKHTLKRVLKRSLHELAIGKIGELSLVMNAVESKKYYGRESKYYYGKKKKNPA